jgi:hypothetical protein
MSVRPLDLGAVLSVASRMRASDRAEVYALMWPGLDTPAQLAMEVFRLSRHGATIHTPDGEPQAALGLVPVWPGVYSAWMFATDRWPEVWRSAVRYARHVMTPEAEAAGLWRAQCHSGAGHASAHRFLAALGFRPEGAPVPYGRAREPFQPWARISA